MSSSFYISSFMNIALINEIWSNIVSIYNTPNTRRLGIGESPTSNQRSLGALPNYVSNRPPSHGTLMNTSIAGKWVFTPPKCQIWYWLMCNRLWSIHPQFLDAMFGSPGLMFGMSTTWENPFINMDLSRAGSGISATRDTPFGLESTGLTGARSLYHTPLHAWHKGGTRMLLQAWDQGGSVGGQFQFFWWVKPDYGAVSEKLKLPNPMTYSHVTSMKHNV